MPIENTPNEQDALLSDESLNRREIAQKAGKLLAYTAPALIALMTAKDAGATS